MYMENRRSYKPIGYRRTGVIRVVLTAKPLSGDEFGLHDP